VLRSTGSTKPILSGALGALILGVGLSTAGIHFGGLPGAALGKVIAECLRKTFYAWIIRRHVGNEAGALLPWSDLGRIGGLAVIAGVPAAAMLWAISPGVVRLAAVFVVYAVGYIVLVLVTRTLTASDRELLRRWSSVRFLAGRHRSPTS